MRKYYNEFNEDYERGYRAGRREALRNLNEIKFTDADAFIKEYPFLKDYKEVYSKVFKIAKKYGFVFDVDREGHFCLNDGSHKPNVDMVFTHESFGKPQIGFGINIESSCNIYKEEDMKKVENTISQISEAVEFMKEVYSKVKF